MTFLVPIIGGEGLKRTFLNSAFLDSIVIPQNPITFTSRAFGAEFPERRIVAALGVHFGAGNAVTGVTIGGVNTSIVAAVNNLAGGAVIAIAHVPTGAVGNIVVTANGTLNRVFGAFYSVSGLDHQAVHRKLEVAGDSGNLDVPGAGICIAANLRNFGAITWGGLTEDTELSVGTAVTGSAASAEFSSGSSGHAVSSSGGSTSSLCAASWGP